MSIQWDSRDDEEVRPAGDGPLMQEFYAEVAKAMRDQDERAAYEQLAVFDRVNVAQRGPQWRTWVTALALGVLGGVIGAGAMMVAINGW